MATTSICVEFALCDPLNPSCGYQLRIGRYWFSDTCTTREDILRTTVDPATGETLKTGADCVRVLQAYI